MCHLISVLLLPVFCQEITASYIRQYFKCFVQYTGNVEACILFLVAHPASHQKGANLQHTQRCNMSLFSIYVVYIHQTALCLPIKATEFYEAVAQSLAL